MSVANPTSSRPAPSSGGRIMAIALTAVAGAVAFIALVTGLVLVSMLATGTLKHTAQGWVFEAHAGTSVAAELREEHLDPRVDSIIIVNGSGTTETRQFVASGPWTADWAYSCPSNSSAFHLVAQGATQAYPAGAIERSASAAGNSNRLPAGAYILKVTTGTNCTWTVGARPNH